MKNMENWSLAKFSIASLIAITASGCTTTKINPNVDKAPPIVPHYIDQHVEHLSKQLADETRKLANLRQAKYDATRANPQKLNSKIPESAIFSGLETKRTLTCEGCDVKTVAQALSALLGWDAENSVYEIGQKPAQGVPVTIELNNEPLRVMLDQIKVDAGHIMDMRIDPNFKTILIEYKSLGITQ